MATLATLNIGLRMNTAGFARSVGAVQKGLGGIAGAVTSAKAKVVAFTGAIAGLAGAAGFGALIKSQFDAIDSLAKTSDKLGIATEALAGLRHAAELSGVGAQTMDTALQRMTRRLSDAAQGSGPAVKALQELGLSASSLAGKAPEAALGDIADAMQQVSNQSDRVRLAFALFDSEGVGLVNTLAGGSAGLRAAAEEAAQLGVAVNRVDAAKIEQANDAFFKIGQAVKGIAGQIAIQIAPAIEFASNKATEFFTSFGGGASLASEGMEWLVTGIEIAGNVVDALGTAFKGLRAVISTAIAGAAGAVALLGLALQELINLLPGVETTFGDTMAKIASRASANAARFRGEFTQAVGTQAGAGTRFVGQFRQFQAESAARAQASADAAAARNVRSGPGTLAGFGGFGGGIVAAALAVANKLGVEQFSARVASEAAAQARGTQLSPVTAGAANIKGTAAEFSARQRFAGSQASRMEQHQRQTARNTREIFNVLRDQAIGATTIVRF